MNEKSSTQETYSPEQIEDFRRLFQAAILQQFRDNPPPEEPLMPWEEEEPEETK